jgi:hypothetical protein
MGYPAVGARPRLQGEAAKAPPKGCKVEGGLPPTFKPKARFRSASARSASAINEGARVFGTGVPAGLASVGRGKGTVMLRRKSSNCRWSKAATTPWRCCCRSHR